MSALSMKYAKSCYSQCCAEIFLKFVFESIQKMVDIFVADKQLEQKEITLEKNGMTIKLQIPIFIPEVYHVDQ